MRRSLGSPMRTLLLRLSCLGILLGNVGRAADEPAPGYTEILKIDAHSHVFEDVPALHALLRKINLRTVNVCNNGTDENLARMHAIAVDLYRAQPQLYP